MIGQEASDPSRTQKKSIPFNLQLNGPQHDDMCIGATDSSSTAASLCRSVLNEVESETSVVPIPPRKESCTTAQNRIEEKNALEWVDALWGFMNHSAPVEDINHTSEQFFAGSSNPSATTAVIAETFTAGVHNDANETTSEDPVYDVEELTLATSHSNRTPSFTLDRPDNTTSVEDHVPSLTSTHGTDTSRQESSVSMNIDTNSLPNLAPCSQHTSPVVPHPRSTHASSGDSVWLPTTERRFLSADRHLFRLLDAQERRIRACDDVWGRATSEEHESKVCSNVPDDIGICASQSLLFGPEFYGLHQGPTSALPRLPNFNTVSNSEGVQGQDRNQVIASEIDNLFR